MLKSKLVFKKPLEIISLGFEWFKNHYVNHLERLEDKSNQEIYLRLNFISGQVYDILGAPKKALQLYSNILSVDDKLLPQVYWEIADIYTHMGQYKKSENMIEKFLKFGPKDKGLLEHIQWLRAENKAKRQPVFSSNDVSWQANEYLAEFKGKEALRLLTLSRNRKLLLDQAKCYGLLNEKKEYLRVWNEIKSEKQKIYLSHSDWFYMPQKVSKGTEIWQIFLSINDRIEPSFFVFHDSLDKNYKDLNIEEKRELMCRFNIYRHSLNLKEVQKMAKSFPKWSEVQRLGAKLKKENRRHIPQPNSPH